MNLNDTSTTTTPPATDDLVPMTETEGLVEGDMDTTGFGDPLASDGGGGRKMRSSTLLLIGVVGVAAISLYSLRTLGRVTAAGGGDDAEQKIKSYLSSIGPAEGGGELSAKERLSLSVLEDDYAGQQVPLDAVARNPFIVDGLPAVEPGGRPILNTQPKLTPEQIREQARTEWTRIAEQELGTFTLKSVLMSHNPLANLSGEFVRIGDVVRADPEDSESVAFTIVEIKPESVTVKASNRDLDIEKQFVIVLPRNR